MNLDGLKNIQKYVRLSMGNGPNTNEDGGPGSGNWGHAGIPGHHGGSQPGGGKRFRVEKQMQPDGHYPWSEYHQREQKYTGLVWAYRAEAERNAAIAAGKTGEDLDKALAKWLGKPSDAAKKKEEIAAKADKIESERIAALKAASGMEEDEDGIPIETSEHKVSVVPVSERQYTPEQQARRDELDRIASERGEIKTLTSEFDKIVDTAESNLTNRLKEIADGDDDAKWAQKILDDRDEFLGRISEAMEKHDFVTDISAMNAIKVLEDGFLKNQFETGASDGGEYSPARRGALSKNLFGTDPESAKPYDYEKYGHLGNALMPYGRFSTYPDGTKSGEVQIVFDKARVWDRTTYTMDDSLLGEDYRQPARVSDPKLCAYEKNAYPTGVHGLHWNLAGDTASMVETGKRRWGDNCELQFHGPITTNDISHIRIPYSLKGTDEVKTLIAKAGGLGIPVIWDGEPVYEKVR